MEIRDAPRVGPEAITLRDERGSMAEFMGACTDGAFSKVVPVRAALRRFEVLACPLVIQI